MRGGELLVGLLWLGGCGASPCEQLCEVRAAAFAECLEPWQYDWESFHAGSEERYVEQCLQATEASEQAASAGERVYLDEACEIAMSAHASAPDCDAQLEAWEESAGSVP